MTNTSTYQAYRAGVTEPMGGKPRISVDIPAHYEERRRLPTVGAITTHMCADALSVGDLDPWFSGALAPIEAEAAHAGVTVMNSQVE
jgi:hypothetical protein